MGPINARSRIDLRLLAAIARADCLGYAHRYSRESSMRPRGLACYAPGARSNQKIRVASPAVWLVLPPVASGAHRAASDRRWAQDCSEDWDPRIETAALRLLASCTDNLRPECDVPHACKPLGATTQPCLPAGVLSSLAISDWRKGLLSRSRSGATPSMSA